MKNDEDVMVALQNLETFKSQKDLKTVKIQKSVVLKLGEFLTMYSHLFSIFIHVRRLN